MAVAWDQIVAALEGGEETGMSPSAARRKQWRQYRENKKRRKEMGLGIIDALVAQDGSGGSYSSGLKSYTAPTEPEYEIDLSDYGVDLSDSGLDTYLKRN